jgi:hypothetical protein
MLARFARCLLLLPIACAQGGDGPGFDPPASGGGGQGGSAGEGGQGGQGGEPLRGLGEECSVEGECQSGECVDGVCCATACIDLCSACNADGEAGHCVPVQAGEDPDGDCAPATCDGTGSCLYAEHVWSARFGDEESNEVEAVAADAQGAVVLAGAFAGQISFGGQTFMTNGGTDGFAAKLDAEGSHLWSRRFGDASNQRAHAVALDVGGNVVLTGTFAGTIDFGGGPLTSVSQSDLFVAKLDPLGNHVWSKAYGPVNAFLTTRSGYGIAVDTAGNVWVTGSFAGQLDFEGNVIDDGQGTQQSSFLVKLHGLDGAHLWSRAIGTAAATDRGNAVVAAPDGDVVVCGQFQGTVDFGAGQIGALGADDAYVARLTSGGAQVWAKSFGSPGNEVCSALAVDGSDRVWLTGFFDDTVDFGGGELASFTGAQVFLAALGDDGEHVYSEAFGGIGGQTGDAVVVDGGGNVVLAGTFDGQIDLGGDNLISESLDDVFVAKLGPDGDHRWSRRYGKNDAQELAGLALAPGDKLAVAVSARGSIDFGGQMLQSFGAEDVTIAVLGP